MTFPTIRAAAMSDAPQLVEFNRAMAKETEGLELDAATVDAGVRALLAKPEYGFYIVAAGDGRLAGSVMVTTEWSDWRNGLFWWLQSVYVRPEYRRRGVYRGLYRYLQEQAGRRADISGFRLYVERDNQAAQRTYESLGMSATPYLVYEHLSRDPGA